MNNRTFNICNRVIAIAVFAVALCTYLMTMEPSASFWDCGEFIASSYKMEVGHPPGNPVFQLFGRFFTIFSGKEYAAVLINAMSALCSAFTIVFLYLTILFFSKRLIGVKKEVEGNNLSQAIILFGSAAIGSLVYCFSDTFWFSAVEGEVYAMSSLFTALVVWAMTKWYEQADTKYANRWIVLICFLMGLSIGIHLLNLLTIPALVFMFYYKKKENGHYSFFEYIKIFALSVVILATILYFIVLYLPKFAAYFDLFFVNILSLPYNSGAVFFVVALLAICFWGIFKTIDTNKVVLNTVLLCFTSIIIGFSTFSIVIIRSNVKTPTNEYQPDNPFTLIRYLGREQYGSNPLIYGQYFDAPYELVVPKYWAPLKGKYKRVDAPAEARYLSSGKMLFPRMWSKADNRYVDFYNQYTKGKGRKVEGAESRKPTFLDNLIYFFDYQLNWMYWRYFMWNFAGRQNDIHSPSPGALFEGNWECGIKFIDEFRLGKQDDAPKSLAENKAKNHYYLLPLLLGLLGMFFQFEKDKRGFWLVLLLFFMTGIAIVIYLNQPPLQVRERDYAYAGSFYAFSMWIGLAIVGIYEFLKRIRQKKLLIYSSSALVLLGLGVPLLMAKENWDDHDRSNRFTAVEIAKNYLNSVEEHGLLVTHGDNDTFPLWYAQEVEEIRPDVRICNTSLLGTDWYIDQMKYACNKSAPLNLRVPKEQYLYGTNELIFIHDTRNKVFPLSDVMTIFRHPKAKLTLSSGKKADYIMSRRFTIPVNKDNVIKYRILDEKFAKNLPDSIELKIPDGKDFLTKPELFLLDLLSNYNWDRPLHFLNQGGDLNVGIKDYLMYEGYSYKFVPIKNKISFTSLGKVDTDALYKKFMDNTFTWEAVSRRDYFIDYQNFYTHMGVMPVRQLFLSLSNSLIKEKQNAKAIELLDKCQEVFPFDRYPIDGIPMGFVGNNYLVVEMIDNYYKLGESAKAKKIARLLSDELLKNSFFYLRFSEYDSEVFKSYGTCIYLLNNVLKENKETELAQQINDRLNSFLED